ncbi:14844_t:CDS:2, partial [Acaulospora colombiana]
SSSPTTTTLSSRQRFTRITSLAGGGGGALDGILGRILKRQVNRIRGKLNQIMGGVKQRNKRAWHIDGDEQETWPRDRNGIQKSWVYDKGNITYRTDFYFYTPAPKVLGVVSVDVAQSLTWDDMSWASRMERARV